jgi:hypothetical protein
VAASTAEDEDYTIKKNHKGRSARAAAKTIVESALESSHNDCS